MKTRAYSSAGFAALSALLLIVAALTTGASSDDNPYNARGTNMTPSDVREFDEFPVVGLGDESQGMPLTALLRRKEVTDPTGSGRGWNFVSHIHGDCEATSDTGCAPPIEVQTWPACARNASMYAPDVLEGVKQEKLGAAELRRLADRVEIYSGTVTVVIFADTPESALRASRELVPANAQADKLFTVDGMAAPASGAMEGDLKCS